MFDWIFFIIQGKEYNHIISSEFDVGPNGVVPKRTNYVTCIWFLTPRMFFITGNNLELLTFFRKVLQSFEGSW